MKITSEWVNAYFDKGIDVVNRRVFLGDIDAETVDAAVKGFYLMEAEDSAARIELFISSYGGNIYDALALHDIMGTLTCPVFTFAFGKCMSAAPLLLAAGEPGHRWVAPTLQLMHHAGATDIEGKTGALQSDMKHMIQLEKVWTELISGYSKKTYKWWYDRANRQGDFYFSADEAIEWGIADAIWIEKD